MRDYDHRKKIQLGARVASSLCKSKLEISVIMSSISLETDEFPRGNFDELSRRRYLKESHKGDIKKFEISEISVKQTRSPGQDPVLKCK